MLLLFSQKLTETLNICFVVFKSPKFTLKLKDYRHCKNSLVKNFQEVTGKGTEKKKTEWIRNMIFLKRRNVKSPTYPSVFTVQCGK
jgi:hypothetical protein